MKQPTQNADPAQLLKQALSLPDADRASMAQSLWDSLPEDYDPVAHMDPEIRRAWIEEIHRRVKEIDEGRAVLRDGEEVMRRLKEKYPREVPVSS